MSVLEGGSFHRRVHPSTEPTNTDTVGIDGPVGRSMSSAADPTEHSAGGSARARSRSFSDAGPSKGWTRGNSLPRDLSLATTGESVGHSVSYQTDGQNSPEIFCSQCQRLWTHHMYCII